MHVATDHFINEGDQNPGSTGADGMADGNGPAIHVDFVRIKTEFAHDSESLNGESFVQFVEIHVFVLPTSLLPDLSDRAYRGHHHPFRLDPARGLRDDPHHRGNSQFLGASRAGDYHCGGAIVDARSIPRGDGSIFLKRRLEGAQDFDGGVFPWRFVFVKDDRGGAFLFRRKLDRHDL